MVLLEPRRMTMRTFELPAIDDDSFLLKVGRVTICGGNPLEHSRRAVDEPPHLP